MDLEKAVAYYLDHVDRLREQMQDREAEIRLLNLGLVVLYLCVVVLACHAAFG